MRKAAMNCPSCGGPIAPKPDTEGFQCEYCHAVFYPHEEDGVQISDDGADAELACPVCNAPLVHAAVAKIPVLSCKECHGLLLTMPVLEPVIEELRDEASSPAVQTPPDRGDLKRTVQCPKCHRRMDTHYYSGPGNVIVDSCDTCLLIWLDRGELTRIARAPDEGDGDDSRPY
jgi:Zn-finger nucleic acid-binding protein